MENHAVETLPVPVLEDVESKLAATMADAAENLSRLNDRALAFARERPGTCIVGAVALGFIVGKIAARY